MYYVFHVLNRRIPGDDDDDDFGSFIVEIVEQFVVSNIYSYSISESTDCLK